MLCTALSYADNNTTTQVIQKNIHYGEYNPSDIANNSKNLSIQSLVQIYEDHNATLNKYKIDKNFTDSIRKGNTDEAKKETARFYSNDSKSNIESMKNYILKDDTFKYKGLSPEMVKKSTSSSYTTKVKDAIFPGATNNESVGLDATARIYIFVSSSMPENVIKTYLDYAEKSNGVIHIAIRGFVGGPVKVIPTQEWVKRMITKDGGGEYKVGIEINPNIQSEYGIDRVPAVLYIKNYDPINETHTGSFKKDDDFWISYGAVDLLYALEEIQKASHTKGFTKLIKTLRGDYYK